MNKLVVIALAGVVGVSGQASGNEASPTPTVAVPTANPPLPTAAPRSDFAQGIPSDFGMGIVNPSTLPSKPIMPIAAGTTQVLPRAGPMVSGPMTSILPRAGPMSPMSPMSFQAFEAQIAAANAQAQWQAMNGNFNGGFFFNTPSYIPSYMPAFNSGVKNAFGAASPVPDMSAGYNSFPGSSVRVGAMTYGTPTITSSNIASVNAALASVSGVVGVGAPVAGLPAGATNLGPSSLINIPGAFISGIKYGAY